MVAETPSRAISGWVQWWPARTATPSQSRICADFPDFTIPEEVDRFVEGVSVHEVKKLLG